MSTDWKCPFCGEQNTVDSPQCERCLADRCAPEPINTPPLPVAPHAAEKPYIVFQSPDGGKITVFHEDIVGRSALGSEIIGTKKSVSRSHALFTFGQDGCWYVEDLGSSNGTFVDGAKIQPHNKTRLSPDSKVALSTFFELTIKKMISTSEAAGPASLSDFDTSKDLAVMFTDLKGSTEFYDEMGTITATDWIKKHNSMLGFAISSNSGFVVKSFGDGLMAVFHTAQKAVNASKTIQNVIAEHNQRVRDSQYQIRVGVHLGKVHIEDDDLFGSTVNIASRIEGAASAGQILVSDAVFQSLPKSEREAIEFIGEKSLKGISRVVGLYEVQWTAMEG